MTTSIAARAFALTVLIVTVGLAAGIAVVSTSGAAMADCLSSCNDRCNATNAGPTCTQNCIVSCAYAVPVPTPQPTPYACPDSSVWNASENACRCPTGTTWSGNACKANQSSTALPARRR